MDEPGPYPPTPGPPVPGPAGRPDVRFPAAAVSGARPPPLPLRAASPVEEPWRSPLTYVDPALETDLAAAEPWSSRLHAGTQAGWAPVTILRLRAPMRHTEGPNVAFLDETPMALSAWRAPEDALEPAPTGTPLLSRLRMLHERLLSGARWPIDAKWTEVAGVPAVLDRLSSSPVAPSDAFSLAAQLDQHLGLVVIGSAPPERHEAIARTAVPLAAKVRPTDGGLAWLRPTGWWATEELQLVSESVIARVHLEPLGDAWGIDDWTDEVFRRAPFLRDRRQLGERAVCVPGVDEARLWRFDWQPSGRGRMLTTVVTGRAGRDGFSFVFEVPFDTGADFTADPDGVLADVRVDPAGNQPAEQVRDGATRPRRVPPPPPTSMLVSDAEQAILAGTDRVVLAAVDISEDARDAMGAPSRYDRAVGAAEVAAVADALDRLILNGNQRTVIDRLGGWAAAAAALRDRNAARSHHRLLLGASAANSAAMLMGAATWERPGAGAVASRWLNTISAGDVSVLDAVWAAAFLISDAVAAEWERPGDSGFLAVVLDRLRRDLLVAPDVLWDASVVTPPVQRPPRYRLRTFIDPGSGILIWSGNPQANARWDYTVHPHELPIPKELGDAIDELLRRYDDGSEDLHVQPPRPFTDDEWRAFVSSYFRIVAELQRVLGPAYEISEESHLR